jgi:hypothetical protein
MKNKDQKDVRELQSTIQQETLEEYSNGLYKQSLKDDIDLSF